MSRKDALAAAKAFFHDGRFLKDLASRVAIATESQNPARRPDCERYLALLADDVAVRLGCTVEIVSNPDPAGGPLLIAERHEGAGLPTLLVYGHGDVVSGMEGAWSVGRDPWRISVEGERIYGRGTADNKGQHTIVLLALEAVLAQRGRLGFNLRLLIETSEETGSAGLHEICRTYRERLVADCLIASDGPRLNPHRPTLTGGTRGSLDFSLVCDLRTGAHHSGNWGGLIANPAVILSHAIASLVSATGRIAVRNVVPREIPASVRRTLADVAVQPGEDGPELDGWWGEPGLTPSERVFGWTALEVLAMGAGDPARPVNAIPPRATAHCQIRYTVDTDPAIFIQAIRAHLDAHGFANVSVAARGGPNWAATRLDPDHPMMRWALQSVTSTTGAAPEVLPNAGGSLPNDCFAHILGMPTIWVPHSYAGCSQHAPDEHLLASIVEEGLAVMTGLFWDFAEGTNPLAGVQKG